MSSLNLSRARTAENYDVPNLGPKCPFCGKGWGDRSICGPPPEDWPGSWKEQNARGRLFPGRRGLSAVPGTCGVCDEGFLGSPTKRYCSHRCANRASRDRNREATRAGDRRRAARRRALSTLAPPQ